MLSSNGAGKPLRCPDAWSATTNSPPRSLAPLTRIRSKTPLFGPYTGSSILEVALTIGEHRPAVNNVACLPRSNATHTLRSVREQEITMRLSDWFREWRSPLRQFLKAREAVPNADLDDAAQEVFLRVMTYNRTELIEHPRAYLYRVAANVAAEWAGRVRCSRPHESEWLAGLLAKERPDQDAAAAELEEEVRCAVQTLKPRQRDILKLHYAEGLGYAEIAERLGTTKRSVKRALIRSYESLRQRLDPNLLGYGSDGYPTTDQPIRDHDAP